MNCLCLLLLLCCCCNNGNGGGQNNDGCHGGCGCRNNNSCRSGCQRGGFSGWLRLRKRQYGKCSSLPGGQACLSLCGCETGAPASQAGAQTENGAASQTFPYFFRGE